MSYSTVPEFIQEMLNCFVDIEFIYEWDAIAEQHLFKLKDVETYESEAFEEFEQEAAAYFLDEKNLELLFVHPEDDLIQFSNFETYSQLETNSSQFEPQLIVLQGDNCFLEAAVDCNNECTSAA